jgi:tetratricopeptide (TPR) repeat protein
VAVKAHKPTGAALLPVYAEKGELYTKLKLLDQAFSYLDKAVDVCNRSFGPDDERTATALVNVGKLHVQKGTFAESVFFYRSALRIRRQVRERERVVARHIGFVLAKGGSI